MASALGTHWVQFEQEAYVGILESIESPVTSLGIRQLTVVRANCSSN